MPRKQKKFHFIYKTTCLVTNKYYYGMHSTNNLDDGYLGSGKRIRYSLNKYGKENHICEKLEFFNTRKRLKEREIEIVNESLLKDPLCMNIQPGGGGGFSGEEHRQKFLKAGIKQRSIKGNIRKSFLLKNDENYAKQYKEKISKGVKKARKEFNHWIGRKHSDKTIMQMKLTHKNIHIGENNSQYGTCWITNDKENRKIFKGDLIPDGWRLGRRLKFF